MKSNIQMPLVLDGAIGTELLKYGLKLPLPLWSAIANEKHYKKVVEIHKNYIEGGCDVITTNTFRTSYRSYKKAKVNDALTRSNNSFKKAIKAALEAKGKKDILIAGSIAPLEDCYEPDLFPGEKVAEIEFMEILENFNNEPVDIILVETMGNFLEIKSILKLTNQVNKKVWLSIVLKNNSHIMDGTHIEKVAAMANRYSVDTLLINCSTISNTTGAIKKIKDWGGKWGIYPNLGRTMPTKDGHIKDLVSNADFSKFMFYAKDRGASVIGACCGSTPETIRKMTKYIKGK